MLTMRDARETDLPTIVHLLADDETGWLRDDASLPLDPTYVAAFEAIDRAENHRLIVAEDAGEVLGTMQLALLPGLSFRGGRRMQIEAVRIKRDRRGNGLGWAMIDWAIAEARAHDAVLVQLTSADSRTRAHAFYERIGFRKTHVGMKLYLRGQPG